MRKGSIRFIDCFFEVLKKQPPEVLAKVVLRNFAGKHLCHSLFLVKLQALSKKRPWHSCFPVNFAKFLGTPFLQNTSGWLLLVLMKFSVKDFFSKCEQTRGFLFLQYFSDILKKFFTENFISFAMWIRLAAILLYILIDVYLNLWFLQPNQIDLLHIWQMWGNLFPQLLILCLDRYCI